MLSSLRFITEAHLEDEDSQVVVVVEISSDTIGARLLHCAKQASERASYGNVCIIAYITSAAVCRQQYPHEAFRFGGSDVIGVSLLTIPSDNATRSNALALLVS